MNTPIDTIAHETPAGTYTVSVHYDTDAAAPDYTDDGGLVYLGDSRTIAAQHGDAAADIAALLHQHSAHNDSLYEHEYRSAAAIARYLRITHGLAGILEIARRGDHYFTTTPSTDRYEGIEGLGWAPADATNPQAYTRSTVATYDAWANGEVYGYIVTGPDSHEIDSCWHFYSDPDEPPTAEAPHGLAHMIEQARAAADTDAIHRIDQANSVGAGITALI